MRIPRRKPVKIVAAGPASPVARRNVEIKARLGNLSAAREICIQLGARRQGEVVQTDTYYSCHHGRLKLRESGSERPQLVWYDRPDQTGPKPSNYRLVPVADAVGLKMALAAALGQRAVVRKRREIYLFRNVRIHLDDVDQLGTFLEFEAVLDGKTVDGETLDDDTLDGETLVRFLIVQFNILPDDLLERSYGDMLCAGTKGDSGRESG